MGDETPDSMNLDLNLSPGPEPPMTNVPIDMDTWDDGHLRRMREAVRIGARQRSRWRRFHLTPETVSVELNHLMVNSEAGEGSEENKNKIKKKNGSENAFGKSEDLEDEEERKKNEDEIGGEGSFFDCNICLDLAKSPVVTCCGHLFCWPCLYRWLHFHSDAKECPVCKGEVTFKNVTPIYGRGGTHNRPEVEEEGHDGSSLKVPDRPQARRVESLRQTIQRNMLSLPMDEMIRRLGTRFDLRGDLFAQNNHDGDGDENNNAFLETARESAERTNTLLTRILSARGLRREQNPITAAADEQNPTAGEEGRRFQFRRTMNPHQHGRPGFPTLSSSSFLVEAFRAQPSQQPAAPGAGDDRDSFSSIAAVINSESQVDTAAEIDSLVSISTSSSRRRSEAASRASDLDTGDSRAPRRRRFN